MKKRIICLVLALVMVVAMLPAVQLTAEAAPPYFGIDVSFAQGYIDWDQAAKEIDFAILRCGYGDNYTSQDDAQWARNVSECERLGIPYGVYLYSYATTTSQALSEAQHTIRLLEGHNPTLPVFYDIEDGGTTGTLSNSGILNIIQTYCDAIEAAGYVPGVYSYLNWWNTKLTSDAYEQWPKWVAVYNGESSPNFNREYIGWQYSSTGYVSGVSGGVDVNYWYVELDAYSPGGSGSTGSGDPVYATVTTKQNATVYQNPDTGSTQAGTVSAGTTLTVVASKTDGNGKVWYKTEQGTWILADNVNNITYKKSVNITGKAFPYSLATGSTFPIAGKITSTNPMTQIHAGIYKKSDLQNPVQQHTETLNSVSSYSLEDSAVDYAMAFNELPVGEYVMKVTVTERAYCEGGPAAVTMTTVYQSVFTVEDLQGSTAVSSDWLWPVPGGTTVSSNYGWRDLYGTGSLDNLHYGIDIIGASTIRAAKSGTIVNGYNAYADNTYVSGSCGNYTTIDHHDGTFSIYMHMQPGNKISGTVVQGETIGYMGNTGDSYGAHLHFQIFTDEYSANGSTLNPMPANASDYGIYIRNVYSLPSGWPAEWTTYIFEPGASANLVTITFNANGGSCSTSSKTCASEGSIGSLPTPIRDGYEFVGWYTAASGGTKVTASTIFSSNTTLYARWAESASPLTLYDAYGMEWQSIAVTPGDTCALPLSYPAKAGFYFSGWASTPDAETYKLRPGESVTVNSEMKLYPVFVSYKEAVSGKPVLIYNIADFTDKAYSAEATTVDGAEAYVLTYSDCGHNDTTQEEGPILVNHNGGTLNYIGTKPQASGVNKDTDNLIDPVAYPWGCLYDNDHWFQMDSVTGVYERFGFKLPGEFVPGQSYTVKFSFRYSGTAGLRSYKNPSYFGYAVDSDDSCLATQASIDKGESYWQPLTADGEMHDYTYTFTANSSTMHLLFEVSSIEDDGTDYGNFTMLDLAVSENDIVIHNGGTLKYLGDIPQATGANDGTVSHPWGCLNSENSHWVAMDSVKGVYERFGFKLPGQFVPGETYTVKFSFQYTGTAALKTYKNPSYFGYAVDSDTSSLYTVESVDKGDTYWQALNADGGKYDYTYTFMADSAAMYLLFETSSLDDEDTNWSEFTVLNVSTAVSENTLVIHNGGTQNYIGTVPQATGVNTTDNNLVDPVRYSWGCLNSENSHWFQMKGESGVYERFGFKLPGKFVPGQTYTVQFNLQYKGNTALGSYSKPSYFGYAVDGDDSCLYTVNSIDKGDSYWQPLTADEEKHDYTYTFTADKPTMYMLFETSSLADNDANWSSFTMLNLRVSEPSSNLVEVPAVDPTCTETGLTAGAYCPVCGEAVVEQQVVEALGHTAEVIPAVEPTCTETGLTVGVQCTVCGETVVAQKTVAALGHTEVYSNNGNGTHDKTCSVCKELLADNEAHSFAGGQCPCGAASGVVSASDLVFITNSLSLQSYVGFNCMVRNTVLSDYDSWYVTFTREDAVSGTVSETCYGTDYASNFQQFEYKVYSYQMTDTITATLYAVKNGVTYVGESYSTSVRELAMGRLTASSDAAYKTVLANMLTYGAKAQLYRGYRTADLADSLLGENAGYVTTVKPTVENKAASTANGLTGVKLVQGALGIASSVQLQFITQVSTDYNVEDLCAVAVWTKDGKTVAKRINGEDFTANGKFYAIVVDGLTAEEGRTPVKVTVRTKADGAAVSETWTFSIESYVAQKQSGSGTAVDTLNALMNYYDAAAAYFG